MRRKLEAEFICIKRLTSSLARVDPTCHENMLSMALDFMSEIELEITYVLNVHDPLDPLDTIKNNMRTALILELKKIKETFVQSCSRIHNVTLEKLTQFDQNILQLSHNQWCSSTKELIKKINENVGQPPKFEILGVPKRFENLELMLVKDIHEVFFMLNALHHEIMEISRPQRIYNEIEVNVTVVRPSDYVLYKKNMIIQINLLRNYFEKELKLKEAQPYRKHSKIFSDALDIIYENWMLLQEEFKKYNANIKS
jgi:hypothetical protein